MKFEGIKNLADRAGRFGLRQLGRLGNWLLYAAVPAIWFWLGACVERVLAAFIHKTALGGAVAAAILRVMLWRGDRTGKLGGQPFTATDRVGLLRGMAGHRARAKAGWQWYRRESLRVGGFLAVTAAVLVALVALASYVAWLAGFAGESRVAFPGILYGFGAYFVAAGLLRVAGGLFDRYFQALCARIQGEMLDERRREETRELIQAVRGNAGTAGHVHDALGRSNGAVHAVVTDDDGDEIPF